MMTKKAKSGGMATTSETQAKDLVTVRPQGDALRGSSVIWWKEWEQQQTIHVFVGIH